MAARSRIPLDGSVLGPPLYGEIPIAESFALRGTEPATTLVRQIRRRSDERYSRRITSVYLTGGFANGSSVPVSDLDVVLVLHDPVTTKDEVVVRELERRCPSTSVIPVEVNLVC